MADGEIAVSHRWTGQLNGGHLASESLNQVAIGICLVGNFDRSSPTAKQVRSLDALIDALLDRCVLPRAAVRTHQQINPVFTRCPGAHFAEAGDIQKVLGRAR
jgi:N-acetyl-anhydromuramyl-L-alanine amidase AmpD